VFRVRSQLELMAESAEQAVIWAGGWSATGRTPTAYPTIGSALLRGPSRRWRWRLVDALAPSERSRRSAPPTCGGQLAHLLAGPW